MDILLICLGLIAISVGIIGSVLPALPGPPLSYVGILLLHFTDAVQFSTLFLVAWAVIIIIVVIMDYYVPIWGTKKFGGGRKGAWGSALGVVVGMFIAPPWGIIIGPFVGAMLGEMMDNKNSKQAFRAALGSFIGFLAGTLAKIAVSAILAIYFIKELVVLIWN